MDARDGPVFLAVDVGGHRHRFVKTNRSAEILDEREVANRVTTDEAGELTGVADQTNELVATAKDVLGPDQAQGIALGSCGPPNKDGTFGMPGGFLITTLPSLAHALGLPLGKCAWTNDCTAGAIAASSPWGHRRQSFSEACRPEVAHPGQSFKFRRQRRRGDETRDSYSKVVYATLSSSMNEGCVIAVEIPGKGRHFIVDRGEFQTTPEAGHQHYRARDPFGNPYQCFCGGTGHLESAIAGGLGFGGVSGTMLRAVSSGAVRSGPIFVTVQSVSDRSDPTESLALAPALYAMAPGVDESADMLKASVVEAVAHRIGHYWGVMGAGKVEFGGGMMHSYEQILLPAIEMVLENPGDFALQASDFSTFPDIAVAEQYGADHVWKGALFMLLHKHRFLVTGEENYPQDSLLL